MIELLPIPPAPAPEMEIRVMTPDEVEQLRPNFESRGGSLPSPAISTFLGVFKHGKRVAYMCLQLKLHAQPVEVEDGYSEVFQPLIHAAEKYILEKCGPQWVYTFTQAGRMSQLAQAMGMQMEPWCVMSKLVMPEAPPKDVTVNFDLPQVPTQVPPEDGSSSQEEVIQ